MSRTVRVGGAKPPNLPVLGVVPTLTGRVNPVRFAAYNLYSLDARKVLDKPKVTRYKAITPDLALSQSRLTLTP
jgi:hypothetical protein